MCALCISTVAKSSALDSFGVATARVPLQLLARLQRILVKYCLRQLMLPPERSRHRRSSHVHKVNLESMPTWITTDEAAERLYYPLKRQILPMGFES